VVIALIDPDFIFLRPLETKVAGMENNIFLPGFQPAVESVPEKVCRGSPVAQIYGLGAPWASSRNHHFNREEVCGAGSPCLNVTVKFGEKHYSVGPPYILEKEDLARLTDSWTKFVPM
jgi:hypothetical protein